MTATYTVRSPSASEREPAPNALPATRGANQTSWERIAEVLGHRRVAHRCALCQQQHPQAGPTRAIGCPIHFSATQAQVTRPAPLLGQHTRELHEHDYSHAEIDALVAEGVVEDAAPAMV